MAEVLKMHNVAGLKISAAVEYVARQAEQGLLSEPPAGFAVIANARKNNGRGFCRRTLKDWPEGLIALAPGRTKKKRALHEIEWLEDWLRVWCNPNKWLMLMGYKAYI